MLNKKNEKLHLCRGQIKSSLESHLLKGEDQTDLIARTYIYSFIGIVDQTEHTTLYHCILHVHVCIKVEDKLKDLYAHCFLLVNFIHFLQKL